MSQHEKEAVDVEMPTIQPPVAIDEESENQILAEDGDGDVSMSEGDSSSVVSAENFAWQVLEEDIEQFRRAYARNLHRTIVPVLEHALADVATFKNRVQTEAQQIYAQSTPAAQRHIQQRRPQLLATLQKLRDSLLVAISRRSADATPTTTPSEFTNVKLPQLEIPLFDGKATEWLDFKTQYISSIHGCQLPEGLKFRYLRSLVKGEPLHHIRHLSVTNGNYEKAWEILCSHYDNPLTLLQLHADELINCRTMRHEGKRCTLRELYAYFKQHVAGIRTIERENPQLDATATAYIYLFLNKCTPNIRTEFRKEVAKSPPIGTTEEGFWSFIQGLVHAEAEPEKDKTTSKKTTIALPLTSSSSSEENTKFCLYCRKKTNHFFSGCPSFKSLSANNRFHTVRRLRVCRNCLRKKCAPHCAKLRCSSCNGRHHSLLHNDDFVSKDKTTRAKQGKTNTYLNVLKVLNFASEKRTHSLLATAYIKVRNGNRVTGIKALLDSGSQKSFVSEKVANLLKISTTSSHCLLQGINKLKTSAIKKAQLDIASFTSSYTRVIDVLVLENIIDKLPPTFFPIESWKIPANLDLADPRFNMPSEVDMLLGSDIFWETLKERKIKLEDSIELRETQLGWIVTGQLKLSEQSMSDRVLTVTPMCELISLIERFWKIEECPSEVKTAPEEHQEVERLFVQSTTRNDKGQFVVRLPWKRDPSTLGNSRGQALKRFFYLEKRLNENASLKIQYSNCVNEYLSLGHMSRVEEVPGEVAYYIPHLAVIRETSTTTKLRVVMDASMKTDSGYSLNDHLMTGPVVQPELISTLLRFRMKRYVICGDITKMYRQVLVHPDDTRFQRILWRNSPDEEVQAYELLRVTFGVTSSAFLATRCIKQLGLDVQKSFPQVSSVLLHDMYVDDLLTGGDNFEEVQILQRHVTEILSSAGFPLTKWCASHQMLLKDVPASAREVEFPFSCDGKPTVKTLGIFWRPEEDILQFFYRPKNATLATTKREILAVIAAIYDPLGLVGPVTTTAKIIMQSIWKATAQSNNTKQSWDERLPDDLLSVWISFAEQLHCLQHIKIPRYYFTSPHSHIEIHGFCDASEKAFGAVLYIRGVSDATPEVRLIISKSRVAPLKKQTLPRLELCGALLLAELVSQVRDMLQLQYKISIVRLWCDSTIALSWIHTSSHKLDKFIANRVQKIQNLQTKDVIWDHVGSKDNPADPLSRGLMPNNVQSNAIWWNGPTWLLKQGPWNTESKFRPENVVIGIKSSEVSLMCITKENNSIFFRYSQFSKLVQVTAYVLRFIKNCSISATERLSGPLRLCELLVAKNALIKLAQSECFAHEIKHLKNKPDGQVVSLPNISQLKNLCPFLDSDGILRVGGRLENAAVSFEQKNPIVLHSKHPLTNLIVRFEHLKHYHAGPRLLKSVLRRNFWILRHHDVVQNCIRTCLKCIKARAAISQQFMASLPKTRVTPSRPFSITGVDYTGPVSIRAIGGKHPIFFKAYIAIFVCFSTKAVHLELIGNLSSLAFLNALSRFISRRGKPLEIHSDNGTTFVGAKSQLDNQMRQFLIDNRDKILDFANKEYISWHFIPAYTPHWGGLWESNIKTMKGHVKRTVTATNVLSADEFQTLLAQIEAILNSRPLTPESSDPNDVNALSPGHFLIGGPLTALPNSDLEMKSDSHVKHWKLIRDLTNQFWKRWSNDYLNTLHQRSKWRISKNELKVGDFVLIKEKDLPPTNWCMGRITEVHPGKDSIVRIVSVRTKTGILVRSIVNLVYLPIN